MIKRLRTVFIVTCLAATGLWFISIHDNTTQGILAQAKTSEVEGPALILIYTELFGRQRWPYVPEGFNYTDLDGSRCESNHCELTYDKTRLSAADVVLFHGRDLPKRKELTKLRTVRTNGAGLWVYLMQESPLHTYYDPGLYNDLFNWTMTYRGDSEIYLPYYNRRQLKTSERRPKHGSDFMAGRNKSVIFINSNCQPLRKKFINNMKRYIDVDVYGKCQNEFKNNLPPCPRNSVECDKIRQQYKFYLAFENSNCKDYITEKFWMEGLQKGLIPVVLGGADYDDPTISIPHSAINANKFHSMKELASFLRKVGSSSTLYNGYHEWRYHQTLYRHNSICDVCLAVEKWRRTKSKKTVDLKDFWGKHNCDQTQSKEHELADS